MTWLGQLHYTHHENSGISWADQGIKAKKQPRWAGKAVRVERPAFLADLWEGAA